MPSEDENEGTIPDGIATGGTSPRLACGDVPHPLLQDIRIAPSILASDFARLGQRWSW